MHRYRSHTCDMRPVQHPKAEPMMDTVTVMAMFLLDEDADLDDRNGVMRSLTHGGFKISHINVFMDDAIERARELSEEDSY